MKLSEYAKKIGISYTTAYRHFTSGQLKGTQLPSGTIIVNNPEEQIKSKTQNKEVALYARVSSSENKDNLKSQLDRLRTYAIAKGYTITEEVSEIGSGLNSNRKKLLSLLTKNSWNIIIVEHKDRLARFGIDIIENLLKQLNKKIEIINQITTETEDIQQDLISIITSFSAKIYGQRRSKRKTEKIIAKLQKINSKSNAKTKTINT